MNKATGKSPETLAQKREDSPTKFASVSSGSNTQISDVQKSNIRVLGGDGVTAFNLGQLPGLNSQSKNSDSVSEMPELNTQAGDYRQRAFIAEKNHRNHPHVLNNKDDEISRDLKKQKHQSFESGDSQAVNNKVENIEIQNPESTKTVSRLKYVNESDLQITDVDKKDAKTNNSKKQNGKYPKQKNKKHKLANAQKQQIESKSNGHLNQLPIADDISYETIQTDKSSDLKDHWRLEKDGPNRYRWRSRFTKNRKTGTSGKITPDIEQLLERRPGKGRHAASRREAETYQHNAGVTSISI